MSIWTRIKSALFGPSRTGVLQIDLAVLFNHEGECDEDDPDAIDRFEIGIEQITWDNLKPVAGSRGEFEYRCTEPREAHVVVQRKSDGTFSVEVDRPAHVAKNTLRG